MVKVNPKSLENLKSYEPGQSGNPNGRPKGAISLTTKLQELLERDMKFTDPFSNSKEKCTKQGQEWIMVTLVAKALKGDMTAIKEVLERIEGKVTQKQEVTGKDGGPIETETRTKLTTDEIKLRISEMLEKK